MAWTVAATRGTLLGFLLREQLIYKRSVTKGSPVGHRASQSATEHIL